MTSTPTVSQQIARTLNLGMDDVHTPIVILVRYGFELSGRHETWAYEYELRDHRNGATAPRVWRAGTLEDVVARWSRGTSTT